MLYKVFKSLHVIGVVLLGTFRCKINKPGRVLRRGLPDLSCTIVLVGEGSCREIVPCTAPCSVPLESGFTMGWKV
jgi:hypothetical protein